MRGLMAVTSSRPGIGVLQIAKDRAVQFLVVPDPSDGFSVASTRAVWSGVGSLTFGAAKLIVASPKAPARSAPVPVSNCPVGQSASTKLFPVELLGPFEATTRSVTGAQIA